MDKSKNSKQKINIMNNDCYNNNQNINYKNESQNKLEEVNEILIELEIFNEINEKEIYILCDKNELIKNNKRNENYCKKNNINPPKEFNYFNKDNTKLYLNDVKINFNYKIKINKIGINKIKIKSNINLNSLSSMFYNCYNIINIKFIKYNTNNVTDMNYMFYNCSNLSELNFSSFNTNNVTDMSGMFYDCKIYLNWIYHHLILIMLLI